MTSILSGQFDDFERAEKVASELRLLGFPGDHIETYALNAPGQHDRLPIGGDEDADREARDGDEGAVTGAAMGGAAGLALGALGTLAIPVVGPLAAAAGLAAGAYTGSLAGAVNAMGEDEARGRPDATPRPAGVRVVVNVPTSLHRTRVLETFARHHARSVEEGDGVWQDGKWMDFDPLSEPRWVIAPMR